MEEEILQEKLKQFECQRCSECCKRPGFVYLGLEEADAIAAFLKMDSFDFINRYCDLQDRQRLVLKKLPDESCIFLTQKGCSVYPARPAQCRDFPVRWRTPKSLEYCQGIKKLLS